MPRREQVRTACKNGPPVPPVKGNTTMDKSTTDPQVQEAIRDLGINVPIYRVEQIAGGLRFYLYGHKQPVDWIDEPESVETQHLASPPALPRPKRKPRARKAQA